jgi:hypothetical protein
MPRSSTRQVLSIAACGFLICGSAGPISAQDAKSNVNQDARTLVDYQERVKTYVDLHTRMESKLPPLPKEATPQQIDRNQRELGRLIREGRAGARQGDVFTPDMQAFVKRLMGTTFAKAKGAELRASIMDENPVGIKIAVNGRYPDEVPLATMPPEVLETLPKMPEELEYRFVGDSLVILDVHAHVIVDYVPNVLPK